MLLPALLLSFSLVFVPMAQETDAYRHSVLLNFYQKSAKNESLADDFHALMEKYKGKDPLKLGYKAVSNAVMAKHTWSPYAKLKYLRTSGQIFEQAVALDKQDPEVRFLRYSIEFFVPRYLNMSGHLQEDKKIFLSAMLRHPRSGMPVESLKIMKDFLLRHPEHLTGDEREQVSNLKL